MNILLLEDDDDLGGAVQAHLRDAQHAVHWCHSIAEASRAPAPELALLDLVLPDGDGLLLLRQWRAAGRNWPVIVLTARDQVSDRVFGLRAGADDYLVKPFDLNELSARVDAVARRIVAPQQLAVGRLRLDLETHEVWRNNQQQDLTMMEWAVLACLSRRAGRIYSRSEIEARLHDTGVADAASNSLEVIISRLRKKLGADSISTHRGLGYRLDG